MKDNSFVELGSYKLENPKLEKCLKHPGKRMYIITSKNILIAEERGTIKVDSLKEN